MVRAAAGRSITLRSFKHLVAILEDRIGRHLVNSTLVKCRRKLMVPRLSIKRHLLAIQKKEKNCNTGLQSAEETRAIDKDIGVMSCQTQPEGLASPDPLLQPTPTSAVVRDASSIQR